MEEIFIGEEEEEEEEAASVEVTLKNLG